MIRGNLKHLTYLLSDPRRIPRQSPLSLNIKPHGLLQDIPSRDKHRLGVKRTEYKSNMISMHGPAAISKSRLMVKCTDTQHSCSLTRFVRFAKESRGAPHSIPVNWNSRVVSTDTFVHCPLSTTSRRMPLIEEVSDEGGAVASGSSMGPILRELSARLALPEELLASFMSDEIRASGGPQWRAQLTTCSTRGNGDLP